MKRHRLISILLSCTLVGCQTTEKFHVDHVDRNSVFVFDKKSDPFALVIEIAEDGKLSLNRIETGTLDDTTELREKLGAIFDDRRRAGIEETEIIIDPRPGIDTDDLEDLVKNLADLKASPIRVVRNNQ